MYTYVFLVSKAQYWTFRFVLLLNFYGRSWGCSLLVGCRWLSWHLLVTLVWIGLKYWVYATSYIFVNLVIISCFSLSKTVNFFDTTSQQRSGFSFRSRKRTVAFKRLHNQIIEYFRILFRWRFGKLVVSDHKIRAKRLLKGVFNPFWGLIFKIDVGKSRKVYIHFADGAVEFSKIELIFGLN